jgi:sigma-B regulation protein RsbU (phosphoserine phosphatase)
VGLLPEIDVARVDVTLGPGETLLFYTDGATEARTLDGFLVGEERLSALFEAHHDGPADGVAARVAEALLGLTGGTLRDDLAMLSLGVKPLS